MVNVEPKHPASDRPEDVEAATRADAYMNRQYLDPVFHKRYPAELRDLVAHAIEARERLVPLDGTVLIEASAGTGKTYTLVRLMARHILWHGHGIVRATAMAIGFAPRDPAVRALLERMAKPLLTARGRPYRTRIPSGETARTTQSGGRDGALDGARRER